MNRAKQIHGYPRKSKLRHTLSFGSILDAATCPNFINGDGKGGYEEKVGWAMDMSECIKKVNEQRPNAEGVTMYNSEYGSCYAESKWTHAHNHYYYGNYITCHFLGRQNRNFTKKNHTLSQQNLCKKSGPIGIMNSIR